jgi:hypothetical protein
MDPAEFFTLTESFTHLQVLHRLEKMGFDKTVENLVVLGCYKL